MEKRGNLEKVVSKLNEMIRCLRLRLNYYMFKKKTSPDYIHTRVNR
jgi:hypothetical protein